MSEVDQRQRDQAEIDGLLEHWKSTLELRNDQITAFDKSILWASGGALALTIANADKLGGINGSAGHALIFSWLSFAVSVSVNIASYWVSSLDAEKELKKISLAVENNSNYKVGNYFRVTTYLLNFFALFLFLVGIVFLICHVYVNVDGV